MEINGKTFVVTGGASGLGEATVLNLKNSGANLIILDLNVEKGEALATQVGGLFVKADITSEEEVKEVVAKALEKYGAIHGVINCAGTGDAQRVIGKQGLYPLEQFKKIVEINLVGTFNVIRLVTEAMINNEPSNIGERGVIINTASVAAFEGQVGQTAYSASKAGIVGLTITLARDLSQYGIRVVTIAPGLFNTPLFGQAPEEMKEQLGKQIPFPPRLGDPAEFGKLANSIISNVMLNGETIRLDGAIRMSPR